MDETTHPRTLDEVQRGVETVLRNFIVKESKNGDVPSEGIADDRIDKIGKMSALAIVEASETTARDIKAACLAAATRRQFAIIQGIRVETEARDRRQS